MIYTCPECGAIAEWNEYYKRFGCTRCTWEANSIKSMTRSDMEAMFPDRKFREATIKVTLWHDEAESDESLVNAIETEMNCCHCVYSVNEIEIR